MKVGPSRPVPPDALEAHREGEAITQALEGACRSLIEGADSAPLATLAKRWEALRSHPGSLVEEGLRDYWIMEMEERIGKLFLAVQAMATAGDVARREAHEVLDCW